jgi:protein-L-isoaspartate(D-aspartate) O-methyltransferase
VSDLAQRRRFFAEEIEAVAHLKTPALVEALAAVAREEFLPPGPWMIHGEGSPAPARPTPDADPRHVYHNCSIAIDITRQLFNGAPSVVAALIDVLALEAGQRVLHIGAGLGYYSAVLAHIVGPTGHVTAVEIDNALARQARENLASMPWVDVRHADGTEPPDRSVDAILVNAGVTHPREAWLEALAPRGRLLLPLTATMPAMGANLGKGVTVLVTRTNGEFSARPLSFVAIYSAIGLRDQEMNVRLGQALMRGPSPPLKRLRRDPHDQSAACWLHGAMWCFSVE